MVTSADIKFWTGYEVTEEQAGRYSNAAEQQLVIDGGSNITGELRIKAVCYLIASEIQNTKGASSAMQSESIGGYSYTTKSSTSTSYWLDLYKEILNGFKSAFGEHSSSRGNGVERIDKIAIQMNPRYY